MLPLLVLFAPAAHPALSTVRVLRPVRAHPFVTMVAAQELELVDLEEDTLLFRMAADNVLELSVDGTRHCPSIKSIAITSLVFTRTLANPKALANRLPS